MAYTPTSAQYYKVSTLVVEWIEIVVVESVEHDDDVSTLVVEWIEISSLPRPKNIFPSPPSWWSGLKCWTKYAKRAGPAVSTLVVEWIEMDFNDEKEKMERRSPPSWWSGLKCYILSHSYYKNIVSTLVVEWIEIE